MRLKDVSADSAQGGAASGWQRTTAGRRGLEIHGGGVVLVLSRKRDQSIVINDDITIVVVEIRGDKVRLGVEAPREIPVHRNEVYEAIKRSEGQIDVKAVAE